MTRPSRFPPGWDEARAQRVLDRYEAQAGEEAVAEDEAPFEAATHTAVAIPVELRPGAHREEQAERLTSRSRLPAPSGAPLSGRSVGSA